MLAIDQIASEAEEKGARAVTMEVTKEQPQEILLATNIGKLSLILGRPNESGRESKSPHWRAGYRSDNPRAGAAGCASPPAPVAAAPAPRSNLPKVTIVRNGEMRSDDAATPGRRLNRAHGGAATN